MEGIHRNIKRKDQRSNILECLKNIMWWDIMKNTVLLIMCLLGLLMAGCTGEVSSTPQCEEINGIIKSSLNDGEAYSLGSSLDYGDGRGSCNYQTAENKQLVVVYMKSESLAGEDSEQMKTELMSTDIYKDATSSKEIEEDGKFVYAYLEGKQEGFPMQSVILRLEDVMIQVSVIVVSEDQFYSESEVVGVAKEVGMETTGAVVSKPEIPATPASEDTTAGTLPPDVPEHLTSCVYSGTWDTDWGTMTLVQDGLEVTGTYTHDSGKINGIIVDGVFMGKWSEDPSYSEPNDAGDAVFYFTENCNSFSGIWNYGVYTSGEWSGTWVGTKVS